MPTRGRQLLFLFWVVPALIAAFGMELVSVRYNPSLTFAEKFGAQLLMWEAWWVWSTLILEASRRVPLVRGGITRALLVHAALCSVVVVAQIFVVEAVSQLYGLSPAHGFESILYIGLRSFGDVFVVVYCAIVGVHAAFRWHDAWRLETVNTARLAADLARAQLDALRAQLNPHFLFNSLNSVMALIDRDPRAAQQMLVRLADLLRSTLALQAVQEVPLRDELALVRQYLAIEEIRFADRLRVEWCIDDGVTSALVPALVLQPLVENAVVHGIACVAGPGRIAIGAARRNGALVLSVRDNGPGPGAPSKRAGAQIGVANLRARLQRLYGPGATVSVSEADGGGCVASVTMPLGG